MSDKENSNSINIHAPPEISKGVYANFFQVQHTGEEFVLDFFNILPPHGSLNARVVVSPQHLKRLTRALQDNIKKYEEQFGTISLAVTPDRKIDFK